MGGLPCPTTLQQAICDSVRSYLQPAEGSQSWLLPPLNALEDLQIDEDDQEESRESPPEVKPLIDMFPGVSAALLTRR
ncbi:hypothetical protein CEP52_017877 [Fusarium oligoseptatum]|uniref:Uncharacterized protein n=1 Tax=Fusarium oligoseptatum TaxID=2604345 RepID=A0A428RBZ2_9HYPO|nr:hypothetical protein CEP52_017877 [Fusarium oligoseptatum]